MRNGGDPRRPKWSRRRAAAALLIAAAAMAFIWVLGNDGDDVPVVFADARAEEASKQGQEIVTEDGFVPLSAIDASWQRAKLGN
jgi:hypothetical protein